MWATFEAEALPHADRLFRERGPGRQPVHEEGGMATTTPLRNIKALAFDAYGTLFDVFSVTALCEQLFPGNGTALAQLWRAKQLQYSLLRSLMGRYKDFWQLTEDGLLYASKSLKLDLTASKQRQLMDAYLSLTVFPDVRRGLQG